MQQLIQLTSEFGEAISELDQLLNDMRRKPMLDRDLEEDDPINDFTESTEESDDDIDYLDDLEREEEYYLEQLNIIYNNLP